MNTIRFKDADWMPIEESITVVGAGGIGSPLLLALSRCNISPIIIYDNDVVSNSNLGTQLHMKRNLSVPKVNAVKDMVSSFGVNPDNLITINSLYTGEVNSIMFSAVDNMSARKQMFEDWKNYDDRKLFIDGRIAAETLWVYVVQKGQEALYENNFLPDDAAIPDEPCTLKATTHIGMLCAGFMVSNFTNFLTNQKLGVPVRTVNFRTEYQIVTGNVITKQYDRLVEELSTSASAEEVPA